MHIDEMRSLLELWYDEAHLKRWKAKRQGEFKVFNSVAQGLRFLLIHMSLRAPFCARDGRLCHVHGASRAYHYAEEA